MSQTLYAKDLSLSDLEAQFGLQIATQPFLIFPEDQLPPLTDLEKQMLERVRRHYLNLTRQPRVSEESVKMVIVSPLLDLAGFYDPPYGIETETAIELQVDDDGTIVRGAIDILIVQKRLWVLVIESKRLGLDVMVALPQALAYMLTAPLSPHPTFALLANGREFVFVQLTRHNPPEYSISRAYSTLYPTADLGEVLQILKYLGQVITTAERS